MRQLPRPGGGRRGGHGQPVRPGRGGGRGRLHPRLPGPRDDRPDRPGLRRLSTPARPCGARARQPTRHEEDPWQRPDRTAGRRW
ncbi:Conserved oligomeric Golgi complex component 8 [Actinacidiphila cocklensis]|uniref:Conserved oligomeric Golgi complex component 8 n=1 Tax=Actinacidiphila cocklensis TaxID=887465 RepID=A0A9W4DYX3_9ACTN|nr:Conserved oligomeric Golgi complex component 8 [Actinacidiphila cocklensis]